MIDRHQQLLSICLVLALATHTVLSCNGGGGGDGSDSGSGSPKGGDGGKGNPGGKDPDNVSGNGDVGNSPKDPAAPGQSGPLDPIGLQPSDTEAADPSKYTGQKDPVSKGEELKCDFSGPCCWNNDASHDTLDYRVANKKADAAKWKAAMNDQGDSPEPKYIVTASAPGDPAPGSAQWVSCPVKCAKGDVLVTLSSWHTKAPAVEVCWRKQGTADLQGCQPTTGAPNVVSLTAPGSGFEIVINGKGLDGADGGIIAIDDLVVDFEPCADAGATTGGPAAGASPNCAVLDGDMATKGGKPYSDADMPRASPFDGSEPVPPTVQDGTSPVGNPSTGIDKGPDGKPYYGSELTPGKVFGGKIFDVTPTDKEQLLTVVFFEATAGMRVHVCYNTINEAKGAGDGCASSEDPDRKADVSKADNKNYRVWRAATFTIPPNTKKLFIGAHTEPEGDITNTGWYGIHSMQLVDKPGKEGKSVCDNAPAPSNVKWVTDSRRRV